MEKLLTRDEFRNAVFKRDNGKCVFCSNPAKDAHHILERRLWSDGGYYLSNGASVCEEHHLACERTDITVEQVREACGITKFAIPEHLYDDQVYDKWGNIVLENGQRLKGELFFDESVQKVIGSHLGDFTNRVKYPRTYHCPWSPGLNKDDRALKNMDHFIGKEVWVTEKLDGENTTMMRDCIHARSVDGRSHPSRDWVKNFHSTISHEIPENWRICGENLYAQHSIVYNELDTYFYGFSIWTDKNECLSVDDTIEWFSLLGITPVPTLFRGIYDENRIKKLWDGVDWNAKEGYVIRATNIFNYASFRMNVAKYVRNNHVQTTKHNWQTQMVIPNTLKT